VQFLRRLEIRHSDGKLDTGRMSTDCQLCVAGQACYANNNMMGWARKVFPSTVVYQSELVAGSLIPVDR
jgi:hypothetical protein